MDRTEKELMVENQVLRTKLGRCREELKAAAASNGKLKGEVKALQRHNAGLHDDLALAQSELEELTMLFGALRADLRDQIELFGGELTFPGSEIHDLNALLEGMRSRLVPDGYEWPRFEDGEPVVYRSHVEHEGRSESVQAIYFNRPSDMDGSSIILSLTGVDHEILHHVFPGDSIKRSPVLAADGKPIEVGETVYGTIMGLEQKVRSIIWKDGEPVIHVLENGSVYSSSPGTITHEKPDSWEKLEEDVKMSPCEYFIGREALKNLAGPDYCGSCPYHKQHWATGEYGGEWCRSAQTEDAIRRAKKLAGVE